MYVEYREYPIDLSYLRCRQPERIQIGNSDIIKGLDLAFQTMKTGEMSYFFIHPDLAFGKAGCPPRIPKGMYKYKCDVYFIFEIILSNLYITSGVFPNKMSKIMLILLVLLKLDMQQIYIAMRGLKIESNKPNYSACEHIVAVQYYQC